MLTIKDIVLDLIDEHLDDECSIEETVSDINKYFENDYEEYDNCIFDECYMDDGKIYVDAAIASSHYYIPMSRDAHGWSPEEYGFEEYETFVFDFERN